MNNYKKEIIMKIKNMKMKTYDNKIEKKWNFISFV